MELKYEETFTAYVDFLGLLSCRPVASSAASAYGPGHLHGCNHVGINAFSMNIIDLSEPIA
jgi:hypothetical protein